MAHFKPLLPFILSLLPVLVASADQSITIDPATGGKRFDGLGAVSGGGATSVLLKDYPEPQRSQILDLLFKPKFGAAMSSLYVEIPGDGNSTQGTEPSHMHARSDFNPARGYEWWLMREAKRRNPALTLDACPWCAPGWVGNGQFYSQDMCDYDVKWIQALDHTYGLHLDAIGCRNERGAVPDFAKLLRRTLDAAGLQSVKIHGFDNWGKTKWDWCSALQSDAELRKAVDILSNHTESTDPTPASIQQLADRLGKPIWDTEEHIYDDPKLYPDDYAAALGYVHQFNDCYIHSGVTKMIYWYLVGSVYGIEPYATQPPAMIANSPWSGHYEIKPIIWAYAHVGQFSEIGWTFLNNACGTLQGGGTYVTLKSPADDFSIVIETAGAKSTQTLNVKLGGKLNPASLCVWRTTRRDWFVRQADVKPSNGSISITLDPDCMYSISTTSGQQKGSFANVSPAAPFPFPYHEDFENYADAASFGFLPHYTADICGVFEIAERPHSNGKCLKQVLDVKAQSWAPEWMPYTVLGDESWKNYQVSADILLESDGWAGVMGRVSSTGNGWDGDPNGYFVRLYADGGCVLYRADQKLKGPKQHELAIGAVADWKWNRWHHVTLQMVGSNLRVLVDNAPILTATDSTFDHGLAGLVTGGVGSARNTAYFDDLTITAPNAPTPPPTPVNPAVRPINAH